jgi:glutathione S-transferase
MRVLLRYMDNVIAPSLAMIASNRLAAPSFVGQDPDKLRRQLDRIPLPERRATWEKLMFQATPPKELEESRRRVSDAISRFDGILAKNEWLAGGTFSLADIGIFATFYGLPVSMEAEVNDEATPHLMRWLRACHARPGLQAALAMGKGFITQRAAEIRERLGVAESAAA